MPRTQLMKPQKTIYALDDLCFTDKYRLGRIIEQHLARRPDGLFEYVENLTEREVANYASTELGVRIMSSVVAATRRQLFGQLAFLSPEARAADQEPEPETATDQQITTWLRKADTRLTALHCRVKIVEEKLGLRNDG